MSGYLLIIPMLLLIICPLIVALLKINEKTKDIINFITIVVSSIIVFVFVVVPPSEKATLINFSSTLKVYLKIDGLGRVFAGMVAILWPFAFLYALGYMKGQPRRQEYNTFYILTYAVVLGIAFSGNLITMYFFYEALTFITLPLIVHSMTKEAKKAGRFYLYLSILGSALAFMGIVIIQVNFHTTEFAYQGYVLLDKKLYSFAYLLTFFGFGVKACIFPFHMWLPKAGVAPTPTTALLHAVAVVKAGAFAIMRSTYYVFSFEALQGSICQIVGILFASFTIIFGSLMALKQLHLKRRFAYSTVSNISYIVLATLMCNEIGLKAAVIHLLFHSFAKISIFFACGILNENGISDITYLKGLYKKMPLTFTSILLAGLSITGIPLFAGFISKWYIASACIEVATWYSYVGIVALLISALFTAIYVLTIIISAAFEKPNYDGEVEEESKKMLIPTCTFAVLSLALGVFGYSFVEVVCKLLMEVI